MKILTKASALAALGLASATLAQPAAVPASPAPAAASQPPLDVHSLRPAFVPLVAAPLDTTQASDPIWVTGTRPAHNLIARLTLKPVAAAVVEQDAGQGAGKKLVLVRAYTGDQSGFGVTNDLPGGQHLYCADGAAVGERNRILCLEDRNGDGTFDHRAYGLGEMGAKAEQLSILARSEPLTTPLRYRVAAVGETPEYKTAFANCGKDHDRPRYSFGIERIGATESNALLQAMIDAGAAGRNGTRLQPQRLNELLALSSSSCRDAEKVKGGEPLYPAAVADGVAVARLGELVIQVGPKEQGAPVHLLGLREPQRLYRISYGAVPALSEGATNQQKQLAILQKFDRPVIVTAGHATVAEGRHGVGDVVLTAPFRHGYMGVLTQDTVIHTLLSKRALPKGTVLYGMPMSSRRVTTMYGMPMGSSGPAVPEADAVHLTWCVPVEDEGKWTATCLPINTDGRYTILKGQTPAFAVTGLRYGVGTTTNEGEVPVRLQDGEFGKPLSYRFRIKSIAPGEIVLTQETLFGDAVVDSRDEHIPRSAGQVSGLAFSEGILSFSEIAGTADAVSVKQETPFKTGVSPEIRSGIINLAVVRRPAPLRSAEAN